MKLNPIEPTYRTQVWDAMNELDYTPQHFLNTKYTLHAVIDAIQHRDYDMVEKLSNVVMDLLDHYCNTFEKKFKTAWDTTLNTADVADKKEHDYLANDLLTQDRSSNFPGDQYPEEVLNAMCDAAEQKHRSWVITVEEAYNKDGETIFSYIQLPDELIERMGLNESSHLRWITNEDGTVTIKKS